MYICNCCEEVFETPDTYEERHPCGMGYASEEWSVCPNCGEEIDLDYDCDCEDCDCQE